MKLFEKAIPWLNVPVLTWKRIWFAFIVAVITDTLQLLLGPLGWAFADQGLDLVAMALTSWALGFHMLLLPTFVIEFIPGIDWLPTWTGCVAAVVALRRNSQFSPVPPPVEVNSPASQPPPPPIDVSSTVVPEPPKNWKGGK